MAEAKATREPSVGRIVMFYVDSITAAFLNSGGKHVMEVGEIVPAVIVRVQDRAVVNLRIFRDGPPTPQEHVSGVTQGKAPGQWDWPDLK